MTFDVFTDVITTISRVHFAFWLRDPKKREHTISAKFLIALMFLIIGLMALFARGTNPIASAIYVVFFLATLCFVCFVVVLRSRRIVPGQTAVLVEAYVVVLFLTLLLMFHNVIYPIPFFGVDNVDRSICKQLVVAYSYTLPAALYLAICTHQFASSRINMAIRRMKTDRLRERLRIRAECLKIEVIVWAIFHYVVTGGLVWLAVFAPSGRLRLLEEAVKKLGV